MTPQLHRMFDNKQKQNHVFSPFSCTFLCLHAHFLLTDGLSFAKLRPQPRIGGIAKWPKASVCKTDIRGFKSHSRLSKAQYQGNTLILRFLLSEMRKSP